MARKFWHAKKAPTKRGALTEKILEYSKNFAFRVSKTVGSFPLEPPPQGQIVYPLCYNISATNQI